jgi:hypothetical protein
MLKQELHAFLRKMNNPIYWLVFIIGVILFSSSSWGVDSIFYAVALSGGAIFAVPLAGKIAFKAGKRLLSGGPSRLDYLMAPGGYRRARYIESSDELARKSIVRPQPNMPLISPVEERQTEKLPTTIETTLLSATGSDSFHSAPTEALVRFVPQARAKPQSLKRFVDPQLDLATNLRPPLNMVIGRAILCVGMRGSGKTNTAALILEQIGQFPIPMSIFDYEGDYLSLPTVLARCVIGGHPQWSDAWQYEDHYWQVTRENAMRVGYDVLNQGRNWFCRRLPMRRWKKLL